MLVFLQSSSRSLPLDEVHSKMEDALPSQMIALWAARACSCNLKYINGGHPRARALPRKFGYWDHASESARRALYPWTQLEPPTLDFYPLTVCKISSWLLTLSPLLFPGSKVALICCCSRPETELFSFATAPRPCPHHIKVLRMGSTGQEAWLDKFETLQ